MPTKQNITLSEVFLDDILKNVRIGPHVAADSLEEFKASLRRLVPDYAIVLVLPRANACDVGQPLRLLITPRAAGMSFVLIRVNGVIITTGGDTGHLTYRTTAISVSSPGEEKAAGMAPASGGNFVEAVIGHVKTVLAILYHGHAQDEESEHGVALGA